ncbi:hypothetical protein Bca101_087358 [Brassica carinata]
MRSRGFSARSSQINNVGSINQALMQSMEQKGLMDHGEKDITAWCEDLHEKCHVCCQAFLRSLMDLCMLLYACVMFQCKVTSFCLLLYRCVLSKSQTVVFLCTIKFVYKVSDFC